MIETKLGTQTRYDLSKFRQLYLEVGHFLLVGALACEGDSISLVFNSHCDDVFAFASASAFASKAKNILQKNYPQPKKLSPT